jgi:hypothetical protein
MQRQLDKRLRIGVLLTAILSALGIIGISAAIGKAEPSPDCAQLARIVAGREHSMLDSRRFHNTERQAYSVCARDPASFRKMLRIS